MRIDERHRSIQRLALIAAMAVVGSLAACQQPDAPVAALIIEELPPELEVGSTVRPLVRGRFADGASRDLSAEVVWRSSKPEVVIIDKGVVTAVAVGEAQVFAAARGVEVPATVRVVARTSSGRGAARGGTRGRVAGTAAPAERVSSVATPRSQQAPASSAAPASRPSPSAATGGAAGEYAGATGAGAPPPAMAPPRAEDWLSLFATFAATARADFLLTSAPIVQRGSRIHLGRATVYATWLVAGLALLVVGLARGLKGKGAVSAVLLTSGGVVLAVASPVLARLAGRVFDAISLLTVIALLLVLQPALSLTGFLWRDPLARRSLKTLTWLALAFAGALAWALWSLARNPSLVG